MTKRDRRQVEQLVADARREARPRRKVGLGLTSLGVVGWTVALPTVLGACAGLWLDEHWPVRFSWALSLLLGGLGLGCAQAVRWVSAAHRSLVEERTEP